MKEALFFEERDHQKVQCVLCPHQCVIKEGGVGLCGVRKNRNGKLYSLNYDKVAAINLDPIEKKPLYHFLPATQSLSVAAMGCNLRCTFCQNHSISMVDDEHQIFGENISPEKIVETAVEKMSRSISYTYTEPTVYFELMVETARLAREKGILNVMVTNGFMGEGALEAMAPHLDGANIDLKGFTEDFYRTRCGARLAPVLDTIGRMYDKKIWIELTTLVVPEINSDRKQIRELIQFILDLDANIPWHVSRFFPHHRCRDLPMTSMSVMEDIFTTGREMGIRYLYGGNVSSSRWSHTRCPHCQAVLIERSGYHTKIRELNLLLGHCEQCKNPIPGVWM